MDWELVLLMTNSWSIIMLKSHHTPCPYELKTVYNTKNKNKKK